MGRRKRLVCWRVLPGNYRTEKRERERERRGRDGLLTKSSRSWRCVGYRRWSPLRSGGPTVRPLPRPRLAPRGASPVAGSAVAAAGNSGEASLPCCAGRGCCCHCCRCCFSCASFLRSLPASGGRQRGRKVHVQSSTVNYYSRGRSA